MFALGMLVDFVLAGIALLWYQSANARFSGRVLGYDPKDWQSDSERFRHEASDATRKVLRAWKKPLSDPTAEHDRVVMDHRFRIYGGLMVAFVAIPLTFELLGQIFPVFLRGGVVGIGILGAFMAMLVYRVWQIALVLRAYGEGTSLARGRLLFASGGAAAIVFVLAGALYISTHA